MTSVERPDRHGLPIPPGAAGRHLHILLVEDHVDTADAMATLLGGMGYTVSIAASAAEARRLAGAGGVRPGLVISDLDLPDESGFVLMRDLARNHGLTGIALSGFGLEADVRRSRDAGFARHLTKPVNLYELEAAIRELTAQS